MCLDDNKETGSAQGEYQLFGIDLISEYQFTGRLYIRTDRLDPIRTTHALYFACDQVAPFPVDWEAGKLIYSQNFRTLEGELWDKLYHFISFDSFPFLINILS